MPAHIRSALEDRDEKCMVPGCDVAKGLEIDHHQIAFENDGPTELWNLCRLCHWHHYLKTHCDFAITGEPGIVGVDRTNEHSESASYRLKHFSSRLWWWLATEAAA